MENFHLQERHINRAERLNMAAYSPKNTPQSAPAAAPTSTHADRFKSTLPVCLLLKERNRPFQ